MSALIITTNYGVEQDELVHPLEQLREAGIDVTVAAVENGPIETLVGDKDPGQTVEADTTIEQASMGDHQVLVIPGGTINADNLRTDEDALALVREFASAGRTVASICHGPWLLAEAGVSDGKTLTSYGSIKTDLRNAGATWVDQDLKECGANGWTLLTSRSPDDLEVFTPAVVNASR